jgi:hypothetical protein
MGNLDLFSVYPLYKEYVKTNIVSQIASNKNVGFSSVKQKYGMSDGRVSIILSF